MELEKKPTDRPDRDVDDANKLDSPDGKSSGPLMEHRRSNNATRIGAVTSVCLALIGLAAVLAVMKSGYSLQGNVGPAVFKLAPPDTPRPPPPELQQRGP